MCHTFRQYTEQETLATSIFVAVVMMQNKMDTSQHTIFSSKSKVVDGFMREPLWHKAREEGMALSGNYRRIS